MTKFEKKFEVMWSQVDSNQHMGNIHYNVFATDARVAFLTDFGLDVKTMRDLNLGPVVLNEKIQKIFQDLEKTEDCQILPSLKV